MIEQLTGQLFLGGAFARALDVAVALQFIDQQINQLHRDVLEGASAYPQALRQRPAEKAYSKQSLRRLPAVSKRMKKRVPERVSNPQSLIKSLNKQSFTSQRKIIHVDCDCFYAAIEMRDDPSLANRPIAVGGLADRRGVIATCNYEARAFGVRSAMASGHALKLCPDLLIVRPRMDAYKEASREIHGIFRTYTDLIEPLSLDEAFLDVSGCEHFAGSATRIAQDIRRRVWQQLRITVSAGVAPNKFLAKIASDWNKPDGLFVITPDQVDDFVLALPVTKLHGVGRVTAEKLKRMGIHTCADLRSWRRLDLVRDFGSFGERLWGLAHGVDERLVQVESRRQSVSVENTYERDLPDLAACLERLPELLEQLAGRMARLDSGYRPGKPFVKLKFHDFTQTTLEQSGAGLELEDYSDLLAGAFARGKRPVRLIGVGVRLIDLRSGFEQLRLF